jgi:hypothetical protein
MDIIDLSKFFHTRSEADDFLARITVISEDIYKTNFNLEKSLTEQFGVIKKDTFLTLLRNHNINIGSTEEIKSFINNIKAEIINLPTAYFTMAIAPKEEILSALSEWFLINLKKHVLFQIDVDQKLIGGIKINFNGKFKDYSIKPLFEQIISEVLETNIKDKITNIDHQSVEHVTIGR